MNTPKKEPRTKPITIRISQELYTALQADAAAQAWTVNDEINYRLRAGPVLELLRRMSSEIVELKDEIKLLRSGE